MLHRIELIQGIGLLHEASGASYKLEDIALIYAGNGRGKSTLSSILRSAALDDSSLIEERRTIDGSLSPHVRMQFDNGHKVIYSDGKWSEARTEIQVFDTAFIENNVHSGGQVSTEHRKNLLDFAIGDRAVAARKKEERAVSTQKKASSDIRLINQQIVPYAGSMAPAVFKALNAVEDAEAKRMALDKRRSDAMRSQAILAQPLPAKLTLPTFNLTELFEIFSRTLDDVHAQAEEMVSCHIATLTGSNASSWLAEGQQFDNGTSCPYCGQSTLDVPLISMYQTHFNKAYKDLKDAVARAARLVDQIASEETLFSLIQQRNQANERLASWKPFVEINDLPTNRDDLAISSLDNLRTLLQSLIVDKSLSPADQHGGEEDRHEADRLVAQIVGLFADQNDLIEAYCVQINKFKDSLEDENVEQLTSEIAEIALAETRWSQPVVTLFEELEEAESRLKKAETDKREAREELSQIMRTTLSQYREDLNRHLRNLGAAFEIDEIKTNFLGQAPRSDYGITLRGQSVQLSGGNPSFDTALSEGDKRTLAFAFFIASTLADPNISTRVIVVDDPVSSLDRFRREYTSQILAEMANNCSQLVLLAHDANFLRETRHVLGRSASEKKLSVLEISRTANNYSEFGKIDLDRECETPYFTNYRTVDDFVSGMDLDARAAANALRPLLEGYLHRRFPGKVPTGLMLGQVISVIDEAQAPSPLIHIKSLVPELRDLNAFAGRFHHDTNPGYATDIVDSASVATFGRRVLNLIHGA